MFLPTVLLYPGALAALCVGAGLAVERVAGWRQPIALLPAVGAAALIGLSQLTTYIVPLAPATPYLLLGLAASGVVLGRDSLRALLRRVRRRPQGLAPPLLAYAIALAPVLVAGRTTFSSFMALSDSAVHMAGADYLLAHGQSYAHLDLASSYGQVIKDYYGSSYPSGADTLFGGTAALLGLPLIWAFQPFNAFLLAVAYGPARELARAAGLRLAWSELAGLLAVLGALVYAYELLGSVKEIAALPMLLASGAIVVLHRRWVRPAPLAGALPLALVAAAGISALGTAFGVWALIALLVAAASAVPALRGRRPAASLVRMAAVGAAAGAVAALPTWTGLSGSLRVASTIASTANPGNLHRPLHSSQLFGVWLDESYKLTPTGPRLALTIALIAVAGLAAVVGAWTLLRARAYTLAAWVGLVLLAWLVISRTATTWAAAKTLMLTSPVVVLLTVIGLASATSARRGRPVAGAIAGLLAAALAGGMVVSDAMQYRASNLAPTARYEELAAVGSRFAGTGPALFTDFDEYSLYELRRLDVGGPDFAYPPPRLAAAGGGYGQPVDLESLAPRVLRPYPLIVTRSDPSAARPPGAYSLVWEGRYYEVWKRRGQAPAIRHVRLAGSAAAQCRALGRLVSGQGGASGGWRLEAPVAAAIAPVAVATAAHPRRWGRTRRGVALRGAGSLAQEFALPRSGRWEVWIEGQLMPRVHLSIDGRGVAEVGGQLSGNSLVPDPIRAGEVELAAGTHRLALSRGAATLEPGDGGSAVVDSIFLTPASHAAAAPLDTVPLARWHDLCRHTHSWAELLRG